MITRLGTYSQVKGKPYAIPCDYATTAAIVLSGTPSVDGVTVSVGQRILVKNQTTGSDNGIYIVSAGAWSRAVDMSLTDDVFQGLQVYVSLGTTNANKTFAITTANPITLGSTSLSFNLVNGYNVTTQSTTYAVTATTGTLIVKGDTTSAGFTITLPTAVGNTAMIVIKKIAAANTLTIGTTSAQTIDGGITAQLFVDDASITLISDNANWQII